MIQGELPELIQEMRALVPKPGDDYVKAILVVVKPKDSIPEHRHPEHTVLYYVNPCLPILIEGEPYQPAPGELVYLAPNVPHAVPVNDGEEWRVSVAMLVEV